MTWCSVMWILYGIVCSISVWINLFLVWTCTTSVWRYNFGVKQVTRVDKTIRCDPLSMVWFILSWYDHTNTVWWYLAGVTQGIWCDAQRIVWTKCLWCDEQVLWCDQQYTVLSHCDGHRTIFQMVWSNIKWCDQTNVLKKMIVHTKNGVIAPCFGVIKI